MSLSDPQVQDVLKRYFVVLTFDFAHYYDMPTYFHPMPDHTIETPAAEDRALFSRMVSDLSAIKQTNPGGTAPGGNVFIAVLTPEGRLIDAMEHSQAHRPEMTLALLRRNIQRLGTKPGPPLTRKPAPARVTRDGLRMHLTARFLPVDASLKPSWFLERRLAAPAYYAWSMTAEQASRWITPVSARQGESWTIDRDAAEEVLMHFCPPTETYYLTRDHIQSLSLTATVMKVTGEKAVARLTGRLSLRHPWWNWNRDSSNYLAESTLLGTLVFEPSTRRVRSLQLITDDAQYRRVIERDQEGPTMVERTGPVSVPFAVALLSEP